MSTRHGPTGGWAPGYKASTICSECGNGQATRNVLAYSGGKVRSMRTSLCERDAERVATGLLMRYDSVETRPMVRA